MGRSAQASSSSAVEHVAGAAAGVGGVGAVQAGLEDQLDATGHARVAAAALADVADALADPVRLAAQVAAGDGGLAAGGRQQRGQHAQGGGLAGAVGPQEAEDFAGLDVQVDAGDGFDGAAREVKVRRRPWVSIMAILRWSLIFNDEQYYS